MAAGKRIGVMLLNAVDRIVPPDPEIEVWLARLDLGSGQVLKMITGIGNSHGIYYSGPLKRLFVADGASGDIKVYSGETYALLKTIPLQDDYLHAEGNAAAHILSSLLGASQSVLVENGKLVLGAWQAIYFCEFDGPRSRTILLRIMPE